MIEINAIDGAFSETKVAKRLRSKLNTMIENVDNLVTKLEEEKRNVNETIADPAVPEEARLKQLARKTYAICLVLGKNKSRSKI